MGKLNLFFKLYRNKTAENIILLILYSLLAAIISMVLFVEENNRSLFESQIEKFGFDMEGFDIGFQGTETILGIIAISALSIGIVGAVCLIMFRNSASDKSQVMMHIMGMNVYDLILKSVLDAFLFGIVSSVIGFLSGYFLFLYFAKNIMQTAIVLSLASFMCLKIFLEMMLFIILIIFGGNLYADLRIMEKPIVETLYGRKGIRKSTNSKWILIGMCLLLFVYADGAFHVPGNIMKICGLLVVIVSGILFLCFLVLFGKLTKQSRRNRKIRKVSDLSFCFLCSRSKRDAILAIVISIGTILLCIVSNVGFNIDGMLRSAYIDNMGYSILIRADSLDDAEQIRTKLDEIGMGYTYAYSKHCFYSELNGEFEGNNMFWALVIEHQTDNNTHFYVPENEFYAENYFTYQCRLICGAKTDIFGGDTYYMGALKDNQYLGLVSYNFFVNKKDWQLPIDDSWSPIFLVNASISDEKIIQTFLEGYGGHIESASGLIDELKGLMEDYLSLIVLMAAMIMIVTGTIFYTVIRTDLQSRKMEMYLYRVFGASYGKAVNVIFREYVIIALFASFAVSFTVMFCGELYFYFGLHKHFPLSIPIIFATTAVAVLFVFICCRIAGFKNRYTTGLEVIRDE